MQGKHVGALIAVIILATITVSGTIYLTQSGYKAPILTPNNISAPQTNVPTATSAAPPVGTPASWNTGTSLPLTISMVDRDYLANSVLTELTNTQATFFWSADGTTFNYINTAVAASTGVTVVVPGTAKGIVYVQDIAVSGQNYYVSPLLTQNANSCVTGYDFMDITSAGLKQWIFRCDLSRSGLQPSVSNAGGAGGTAPLLTFNTMAYAYTAPTMNYNNGGSIKSIGTTVDKTSQVLYYASGTAAKAFAIAEFDVKVNSTDNTKWNQGSSNILFPTESSTGAFTYTQTYFTSANQIYTDGTNYYYKWYFNAPIDTTFMVNGNQQTNNLKGAYFYFVSNNGGQTQIPFTMNFVSDFAATTTESVTETITYLTAAQGQTTVSQAVSLCASTTCT